MEKELIYCVYAFILGIIACLLVSLMFTALSSGRCFKCGKNCPDSDVYCSQCGQQLRTFKEETK
jgi:predicted amidophosphoribosyltransferase